MNMIMLLFRRQRVVVFINRLLPFVAVVILATGCVGMRGPENNLAFSPITDLAILQGVYKNKGDPSDYISAILWGVDRVPEKYPDTKHDDVQYIEVLATEEKVTVRAIRQDCAIFEKTYVKGKDFRMEHGRIVLIKEFHALTRGGDDVLVGPSYEKVTIGIDASGHAKYRRSGYATGLVFMLFPVATMGSDDIRFERINDKPIGFKNCSE